MGTDVNFKHENRSWKEDDNAHAEWFTHLHEILGNVWYENHTRYYKVIGYDDNGKIPPFKLYQINWLLSLKTFGTLSTTIGIQWSFYYLNSFLQKRLFVEDAWVIWKVRDLLAYLEQRISAIEAVEATSKHDRVVCVHFETTRQIQPHLKKDIQSY